MVFCCLLVWSCGQAPEGDVSSDVGTLAENQEIPTQTLLLETRYEARRSITFPLPHDQFKLQQDPIIPTKGRPHGPLEIRIENHTTSMTHTCVYAPGRASYGRPLCQKSLLLKKNIPQQKPTEDYQIVVAVKELSSALNFSIELLDLKTQTQKIIAVALDQSTESGHQHLVQETLWFELPADLVFNADNDIAVGADLIITKHNSGGLIECRYREQRKHFFEQENRVSLIDCFNDGQALGIDEYYTFSMEAGDILELRPYSPNGLSFSVQMQLEYQTR